MADPDSVPRDAARGLVWTYLLLTTFFCFTSPGNTSRLFIICSLSYIFFVYLPHISLVFFYNLRLYWHWFICNIYRDRHCPPTPFPIPGGLLSLSYLSIFGRLCYIGHACPVLNAFNCLVLVLNKVFLHFLHILWCALGNVSALSSFWSHGRPRGYYLASGCHGNHRHTAIASIT